MSTNTHRGNHTFATGGNHSQAEWDGTLSGGYAQTVPTTPRSSTVTLSDVLTPLRDYLAHDSFRCVNRDRWPSSDWDKRGDCHCGLVVALIEAG
jgi:hypothetical protein